MAATACAARLTAEFFLPKKSVIFCRGTIAELLLPAVFAKDAADAAADDDDDDNDAADDDSMAGDARVGEAGKGVSGTESTAWSSARILAML
jgi:hypothetical protein